MKNARNQKMSIGRTESLPLDMTPFAREPFSNGDLIAEGIEQVSFPSPHDESMETFLLKDFRVSSEAGCPLVVVNLHGAASHEDQGMTAKIYDGAFEHWAKEFSHRQVVYICPEYRGGSWMGPAAEADLLEILRWVRMTYSPRAVILMGGSMGGTSALIFAARHPELLRGVIALCPATDPAEMFARFSEQFRESYGGSPDEVPQVYRERATRFMADQLRDLPMFIIHGSADEVIPVHHSRLLVEKLGEKCRSLEIEGGDHDSPVSISLAPAFDFILSTMCDEFRVADCNE